MLSMLGGELKVDFRSRWTYPRVQRWLYGYDVYKEAGEEFRKNPFQNFRMSHLRLEGDVRELFIPQVYVI